MNIIFVTNGSFGTNDATGGMLDNLFEGLPETKILQYSIRPILQTDNNPISIVSFLPDIKYSIFSTWIYRIDQKLKQKRHIRIWKVIRSGLFFMDEIIPPFVTPKELHNLDSFDPDLIYTLAGDIKVLRISRILAKRYNKAIVIHNMDDYYNIDCNSSHYVRRVFNALLRKEYKLAYRYSYKSLAIGPKMAKEYSELFNLPFDWVMNCVKSDNINKLDTLNPKVSLIIFSGGLHGGRANTLSAIAQCIETIKGIKLEIYTGKADKEKNEALFNNFNNTSLYEYVAKDKMFDNLSRADVLLHVESYEPQYITYFRLSMSTKIPEYMASCRPILCVGPSCIATVDFIKEYRIGHVVHDVDKFDDALLEMQNAEYRNQLVVNATCCLNEYFTKSKMQNKLNKVFDFNINASTSI